ncbi:helix-turn-helix transcriptional regulator [Anabaena sp. UHCC 0451]|uniref:helix-turn-helix domain-containing protein n=1 Tax=Anabaena sp. UHCC 0451 TaxID=2055235 RepID=UPI002B1F580A|nr:helix-turn-helix transcriptional regulator [Anabaena sp. UHCC 0451]MEA5576071.1 helix-turn-helix transcriptional regulator [Anabaena sp. UHCC 0451]
MKINENNLYQQIGRRIKQRRTEMGMTQAELADAIGVLRTSITNIEAGRQKAPLHVLYQLCIVLDVKVAAILPTEAEVTNLNTKSTTIEDEVKEELPKTAEFLQQLMEE